MRINKSLTYALQTWQTINNGSYRTSSASTYTEHRSPARPIPSWTRFPKIYRPETHPITPTHNSRNFVSTF